MEKIDIGIRSKQVSGGRVQLTIAAGIESTMAQLTSNELIHLLHTLSKTSYAEATEQPMGFPYAFPLVFGM
jgi:hypothetical protein